MLIRVKERPGPKDRTLIGLNIQRILENPHASHECSFVAYDFLVVARGENKCLLRSRLFSFLAPYANSLKYLIVRTI